MPNSKSLALYFRFLLKILNETHRERPHSYLVNILTHIAVLNNYVNDYILMKNKKYILHNVDCNPELIQIHLIQYYWKLFILYKKLTTDKL